MAQARQWTVHPDPETGEVHREELADALYDASVMLRRAGGAVSMLAVREPVEPGHPEHVTTHVVLQWLARTDSAPRFEAPAPDPAPEPEPEPTADEKLEPVEA